MICTLCPRECGVDRAITPGICGAPYRIKAALALPFFFEEPPISGDRGSGAVFFSHCNLACAFCQNHTISAGGFGREIDSKRFVAILFDLAGRGVHNINLVSPTPYTHLIAQALRPIKKEFPIPIVWNSNGYEKASTLRMLEGLVDVYLPDLKYISSTAAHVCSSTPGYPEAAIRAIDEMHRQVGDLDIDRAGIARRGLMIRHLVLPGMTQETRRVLSFVARRFGTNTHISLMSQYYPTHRAQNISGLSRRITPEEYEAACDWAISLGFENGWFQEEGAEDSEYTPEFDLRGILE